MMKRFGIRFSAFLVCLVTLLMACAIGAFAALDTAQKGSVTVEFAPDGAPAEGAVFKLLKLADVDGEGYFTIDERFKDTDLAALVDGNDVARYTEDLAEIMEAAAGAAAGQEADLTAVTDAQGKAVFEDLPVGLYLVGGDPIEIGDFVYTPQNAIVCIPTMEDDGSWTFDQTVVAKWDRRDADRIALKVLKVWSDSATNVHANDSVTVHLYKGDDIFDTQVLNKANNWTYTWPKLNPKYTWTVVEDKITDYEPTITREGDVITITNKYTGEEEVGPLPATGLLWWPLPILIAGGVAFLLIGFFLRRKGNGAEK